MVKKQLKNAKTDFVFFCLCVFVFLCLCVYYFFSILKYVSNSLLAAM